MPSNPECSTIQKKIQHRDSTSIVLKITQFSNSTVEKLCIQQNGTCTSTSELGHFSGLNPSTAYNFPVFSYVDELEKPSVRWLSRLNCSFLVFTREFLLSSPKHFQVVLFNRFSSLPLLFVLNLSLSIARL